jgi:hypothetical protein
MANIILIIKFIMEVIGLIRDLAKKADEQWAQDLLDVVAKTRNAKTEAEKSEAATKWVDIIHRRPSK